MNLISIIVAVTGLDFFDELAPEIAKHVTPSELEITSVIDSYLKAGTLSFTSLNRGTVWWLDIGNQKEINDAANYVRVAEE